MFLTLAKMAKKINPEIVVACVIADIPEYSTTTPPKGAKKLYHDYENYYESIARALDTIPDDVPVAATTFYTVHLSDREVLYDVKYCSLEHLMETEYVALHITSTTDFNRWGGYEGFTDLLQRNGYGIYHTAGDYLAIYRKTPSD